MAPSKHSQRLYYLDAYKTWGIYLVILGHLPITNIALKDFIFSFHMPLFFLCSGYLFREVKMDARFIKNNAMQLLGVMIPIFLIGRVFGVVQDYLFYRNQFTLQKELIYPLRYLLLGDSRSGWIWFLWALFWMRLVYNGMSKIISVRHKDLVLLVVSIVTGYVLYLSDFRFNYYQISAFLLSFPFFCLGQVAKQHECVAGLSRKSSIVAIILLTVSYVFLFPHIGHINMNALEIGTNYTLFLLIGSVANLDFMLLARCISWRGKLADVMAILSSGTIVILCFHGMLILCAKIAYKHLRHIQLPPPHTWMLCRAY